MEQKFSNLDRVMEAANHSKNSVMEAENHVKHGASSKSQMSRGEFLKACVALSLAPTAMMIGCGGGSGSSGSRSSGKIKMTTEESGNVAFSLSGSGVATVDWGDGSEKVTLTLNEKLSQYDSNDGALFRHAYPSASIRTIIVNGDNIEKLYCSFSLTELDVSRCAELTFLSASGNFTGLDLRKNTTLTRLGIGSSQLTSLDLSKNSALTVLGIWRTPLTSLDLSKNTALTNLNIGSLDHQTIPLTSLDLSKNSALTNLYIKNTQLTSLVLNTALTDLDIRKAPLMSLDLSKSTVLEKMEIWGTQLTSLDLSKNTMFRYLTCHNNQLTADALNNLFKTLHSNPDERGKYIQISGNPGYSTCDRSIATSKGWSVR